MLAVPPAVMTVIGPVVADAGTVATMEVLLQVVGRGHAIELHAAARLRCAEIGSRDRY